MLKKYACKHQESKGRLFVEKSANNRTAFQRDRDRIVHSQSFRRLEYKTQVFVNYESDHFRTRLTHSLEVAQIARVLAKKLGLDEDLTEAIALAHDIGHPPFGHAGEYILHNLSKKYYGFDHNANALKIVTSLESPYAEFEGLNLSFEVLEGIIKHNGIIKIDKNTPYYLKKYNKIYDLKLAKYPSLEAQIAGFSDDIAYNNHDIDDGFNARLITVEDFDSVDLVKNAFLLVEKKYGKEISFSKKIHQARGIIYTAMIDDIINTTSDNIKKHQVNSVQDIYNHKKMIAGFSAKMKQEIKKIKKILFEKIYHHHEIAIMSKKSDTILTDLFNFYQKNPNCLEKHLQELYKRAKNKNEQIEIITDYLAGMTDRFAIKQHKKIFDLYSFESKFR